MSIEATRAGFEASFEESNFYNKQTQDENHLNNILKTISIKPGMKILDLGCGSGYLTFPIAERNQNVSVIGLDIVTDTLKQNSLKAQEMGIKFDKFNQEEFYLTALMMYTDYCKTLGTANMDIYLRLAKDWLEDDDVSVKGGEKLAVYHDCIVEGEDD